MIREDNFIIKIDDDYLVSFDGGQSKGESSHMGWHPQSTDLGSVILSQYRQDAKTIEGKINLKSTFDKLYDRMRYGNFKFDHLEIIRCSS